MIASTTFLPRPTTSRDAHSPSVTTWDEQILLKGRSARIVVTMGMPALLSAPIPSRASSVACFGWAGSVQSARHWSARWKRWETQAVSAGFAGCLIWAVADFRCGVSDDPGYMRVSTLRNYAGKGHEGICDAVVKSLPPTLAMKCSRTGQPMR